MMQIKPKFLPILIAAGFAWAGQVAAQPATLDVTLEVIDDVSELDGVVLRLEDARAGDEVRERAREEERARDEFDSAVREADAERDAIERETRTDRTEVRERQNEEKDLERDFEAARERDAAQTPAEPL